ncbi:MAG: WYL domain-containing protein [Kineosporiaceae bacterium]|nr:WYL domain-containing protein [Kineosporiaceae bacterium]
MPATNRTERLLNLVIALAATTRWLTKEQIRHAVPQYERCESVEAFDRMFERDKEDLRELGVPLVTGSHDAWFEDEIGYRIDRTSYELPSIDLTAEELAVLGLASRVWQQASLAGPAARAMVKLRSLGVAVDAETLVGVEPRVRAAEPAFEPLYAATRDAAPVAFRYRKPGEAKAADRKVEPWALTARGGWWYLVGFDRGRSAPRAFKLSRIEGGIRRIGAAGSVVKPDDLDPAAMVRHGRAEQDLRTARVRLRPGRGTALRLRDGASVVPDALAAAAGWDVVELPIGDAAQLAQQLAGYGPDALVQTPEDLRDRVIALLRGARAVHAEPAVPMDSAASVGSAASVASAASASESGR